MPQNEDNWDGSDRRRFGHESTDRWHLGKEVPLALLFAVVCQTAGGVWWLAQLSNKIDSAVARMDEFKIERYTKEDARRDKELMHMSLESIRARDIDLERRMTDFERRVSSVEPSHKQVR